ncbi:NADP-dependent oxidoreductase domain-containing protein [Armillaria novae-zelandiae]|uniref:NADP-dependent oxidoreductase domain-containing protein n=1 Tax=Armillaria novae-zelandiae TaxID=153914 RepID=A0AA39PX30_9AGAR|nr:NADP-dependent oxidoreductase domain-containing protein [Armillaria novae-zelandiae]
MSTTMQYVRLGNSGLKVSRIILGCMSYGSTEWQPWVLSKEQGIEHIKAAYDAGINTFDTADTYSNGLSEVILGEAIKTHNIPREKIVVLTKVYGVVGDAPNVNLFGDPKADSEGYVNRHGLSRKHIFDAVKGSLQRLQLDYIDVLQCHRFDYQTPIAETMHALHDVVKAGLYYAIQNTLTPFISMQNHYSLVYREEEREMFPTLKMFGVGSMAWPISEQKATRRGEVDKVLSRYAGSESTDSIVDRVDTLAKKKGITMAQLSIAWLLSKEGESNPS